MELLQFSSSLFGIVVIYSYYKRNIYYHHLILLLMITSLIVHQKEKNNRYNIILYIDKINAFSLYFVLLYELYYIFYIRKLKYYLLIIYPKIILYLYLKEFSFNNYNIILNNN